MSVVYAFAVGASCFFIFRHGLLSKTFITMFILTQAKLRPRCNVAVFSTMRG